MIKKPFLADVLRYNYAKPSLPVVIEFKTVDRANSQLFSLSVSYVLQLIQRTLYYKDKHDVLSSRYDIAQGSVATELRHKISDYLQTYKQILGTPTFSISVSSNQR